MARNHLFTQRIWKAPSVRRVRHLVSIPRIYRYLSASHRRLPSFIIAGAQKAGTTSLWAYLSEHPSIEPPMTKEIHFFDVNFNYGIDWYRMHYPLIGAPESNAGSCTPSHTGESSPYYTFHPLAAERMAATLPQVKVILLLRNPIDRAYSHYQHTCRRRQESLSFEAAIEAEAGRIAGEQEKMASIPGYQSLAHRRYSYMARGLYLEQVLRWQRHFSPERLLILESNEFFRGTAAVFARVLQFLELPSWQPQKFGNRYPGKYQEKMSPDVRRRLVAYFAPHNEQLYAHLGTRFDWDR
jgi:Sulfotransferase domain